MNPKALLLLLLTSSISFSYSQNVGIGNTSPQSKLDVNGDLALREGSPITVASGSNSITLPSPANSVYRLTGASGSFSINSISAGHDGSVLTLINATGQVMTITNGSSIQTSTGANLVAAGTASSVSLIYNITLAKWIVTADQGFSIGGSGTVTTVSVSSANGLAGTVSNASTTPAITLSTTVTGLLKGNGTAISAATAGTDYQTPLTAGTGIGISSGTISNTGVTSITSASPMTVNSSATGAVTVNLTGIVPIANGGTNTNATPTPGAVSYGTGLAIAYSGVGTPGQVLTSNGSGAPTWSTSSSGSGTVTNVTATSPVSITSTSTTTPNVLLSGTAGGVLYGTGSGTGSAFNSAGLSGQYLQSAGGGAPIWKTPNAVIHIPLSWYFKLSALSTYYTQPQSAVAFSADPNNAGIYYPVTTATNPATLSYAGAVEATTYMATTTEQLSKISGWIWQATSAAASTVVVSLYKYSSLTSGTTYTTSAGGTLITSTTVSLSNTSNGVYSFTLTPGSTTTLNAGDILAMFVSSSTSGSSGKYYYVSGTLEMLTNTQ